MGSLYIPNAVAAPAIHQLHGFADWVIASRDRNQMIDRDDGDPYIDRWYLARKATVPGVSPPGHFLDHVAPIASEIENLYLHRYARADREEPHCHPWPNATLVISGWYDEQVFEDGEAVAVRRRLPGDIVIRRASDVHAIVNFAPGTLSFFATLPKERDWGFHTAEGFIPWADFRAWKSTRIAAGSA